MQSLAVDKFNRSFNVALLLTSLGGGGTERYVIDLSIGLKRNGLNVIVVLDEAGAGRDLDILVENQVQFFCLNVGMVELNKSYRQALRYILQSNNVHLVHSNNWANALLIRDVTLSLRLVYFTTLHSTFKVNARILLGLVRTYKNIWWDRISLKGAEINIISTNKTSINSLNKYWGNKANVFYVPLGVTPYLVEDKLVSTDIKLVWVGSFIERKKPIMMLEIFEELSKTFSNLKLKMIGDGPLLDSCINLKNEKKLENLSFTGFVRNVQLHLNESDLFILTSENEGLSYVTLEAMSVGLPVVVSNCGAVKELVSNGENGYVVAVNSSFDFIGAIRILIEDEDLRKTMGSSSFFSFNRQYTLDHMVQNTISLYRESMI